MSTASAPAAKSAMQAAGERAQLELWQTEWCPSSRRVRQAMTELNLTYLVRQVAVDADERDELWRATGSRSIPVLVADGEPVAGEEEIIRYLRERFAEPAGAKEHHEKAKLARRKELESECPQLAAATH